MSTRARATSLSAVRTGGRRLSAVAAAARSLASANRKGVIPGSAAGRFWWRDRARTQPWDPAVDLEKTVEFADDLTGNPVGWQLGPNLWNNTTIVTTGESQNLGGGRFRIYSSAGVVSTIATPPGTIAAKSSYWVSFYVESVTVAGSGITFMDAGTSTTSTVGWKALYLPANSANINTAAFLKRAAGATDVVVSNITVKEIIRDESWLGANLRNTGAVNTVGAPGTLATYNTSTGQGTTYRQDVSNTSGVTVLTPVNTPYSVDIENTGGTALTVRTGAGNGTVLATIAAATRQTVVVATTSALGICFASQGDAQAASFTLHSIRQIPGHPIVSAVSGSGLVGSKRVNLLQRTEDLTHSAWTTKQNITLSPATDPLGGAKAFRVEAATTGFTTLTQNITGAGNSAAGSLKARVLCKKGSSATDGNVFIVRDQTAAQNMVTATLNYDTGAIVIGTGNGVPGVTATATAVGGGWYEVIITCAAAGNGNLIIFYVGFAGSSYSAGAHCFLAFPDFRYSFWNSFNLPAYQRVGDGTAGVLDYDDAAGVLHLKNVTGTQAMMTLGTVDMSAGDAGAMLANAVKLSDSTQMVLAEFGTTPLTVNGTLTAATANLSTGAGTGYTSRSKGTGAADAVSSGQNAPHVAAVISEGDISSDLCRLIVNGVQAATSATDQGTGNLGNHRLNIAGRDVGGTASLRFTGILIGNLPALVAGDAGIDTLALSRELAAQGGFIY